MQIKIEFVVNVIVVRLLARVTCFETKNPLLPYTRAISEAMRQNRTRRLRTDYTFCGNADCVNFYQQAHSDMKVFDLTAIFMY